MTAKITAYQLPLTEPFKIDVEHNSVPYKLKLKINLKDTNQSTAKLTSDKVYELGKECISWEGIDNVLAKKVPKCVKQAAASNLLHIELTHPINNTFKIRITILSQPLPDNSGVLLVRNSKNFVKQFLTKNSQERNSVLEQMVNCFTEIKSFKDSELQEMIDVMEFLCPNDGKRVLVKIIESGHLEQIAMIFKSLQKNYSVDYDAFLKSVLLLSVKNFINKPIILRNDLNRLMALYKNFDSHNQIFFIEMLFNANGPTSNEQIIENATEAFEQIQQQCYNLSPSQHYGLNTPMLAPLFAGRFDPAKVLMLIHQEVCFLEDNIHNLNISHIICNLTGIITIMEAAISSGVAHWPKDKHFDKIYQVLCDYEKSWATRWTYHKNCRHSEYQVNFLAKFALQMLKMTGNALDSEYIGTRHVFYSIKGIDTTARLNPPNCPWSFITGMVKCTEEFDKAFTIKDKDLRVFLYLNLLQNCYLRINSENLEDFKRFVNDVLKPQSEEIIKKILPINNNLFFVAGIIKLLHSMLKIQDDKQTKEKVVELLTYIENSNLNDIEPKMKKALFRVEASERHSHARTYITDKIFEILRANSENQAEPLKINNEAQIEVEEEIKPLGPNRRLFEIAFRKTFPWIESLQTQLKELEQDEQLIEDTPYSVDLKAQLNGNEGELERLLSAALKDKNLVLISGKPGSGKTLFLKKYVQNLLKSYQIDDPIPFYIPLNWNNGSFENPIESILKKYNLENHQELLKKIPTLWLLDGCDAMLRSSKEPPFNIYTRFNFQEWPNAKFVYSCRSNLTRAQRSYFTHPNKSEALLTVSPLNQRQIRLFFEKYIQCKTKSDQAPWNTEQYLEYIKKLGLMNISQTPYYLKQIADYFPSMSTELSSYIQNFIKPEKKDNDTFVKEFLIGLLVSYNIKKETQKPVKQGMASPNALEYLDYVLEVNRLMNLCHLMKVTDNSELEKKKNSEHKEDGLKTIQLLVKIEQIKEEIKNSYKNNDQPQIKILEKQLEELVKEEQKIQSKFDKFVQLDASNQTEKELQKLLFGHDEKNLSINTLIRKNSNDEIEFAHPLLYDYLSQVNQDLKMKTRLLDIINIINTKSK